MVLTRYQFINYNCVIRQRQIEDEKKRQQKCEFCGAEYAQLTFAMTAYPWDGKGENPNRDLLLCDYHKEEYEEHWNSLWEEYNRTRF